MTVEQIRVVPVADFDYRVRTLTRWLRDTDSFTSAVARWLQVPVEHVLHRQESVPLDVGDAAALEMEPGAAVRLRQGVLHAGLAGPTLLVAAVSARVAQHRLSPAARKALDAGDLPLGVVLGRYAVRRHTHSVTRVDEVDELGGRQVLRVRASLTVDGSLIAVVDETIYRRLLEHRVPGELAWARRTSVMKAAR
ncbi:hypothetical protein [Actinokineospora enzanensis]|uniref:hypothetical protein n=1 Tax=Actinokineospora enzanensis TaxID=155975 RepID=UPI000376020F|nr:hypothetical protein [Actinokineospora enzanensis]